MKKYIVHGLASMALAAATSSAAAQSGLPPRTQDFMRDAIQLATLLGKVHAVRITCNGRGDQYWRNHMRDLLNTEAPGQSSFRSTLAKAFNDSYSRESARRPICDTATAAAEAQYAAEGAEIAERLAVHYLPK
ncbi:MAG: TIGR02301 family protein [Pseudomonadota bacterium]